ncbi:MAG: hypothetical protein E3J64_05580 [Anaerolineales bacterium]|nr:MAG: hypothetical protein E3J64_05580 [Anaerolineales bacterium]
MVRCVTLLLLAVCLVAEPGSAWADSDPSDGAESSLSRYWPAAISRWESVIVPQAEYRGFDPDLIAALILKESEGDPQARSVVGATGLMQLMPWEGRPSPEELEDPYTNVFWGTRALAQTLVDGNGDLYYTLAAYNGGWGQVHLRVTREYAAHVLGHYARAVAVDHGLPSESGWIAILAIEGMPGTNTITVVTPDWSAARYTPRPWIPAPIPAIPDRVEPHATAAVFTDADGNEHRVNLWLVTPDDTEPTSWSGEAAMAPFPMATNTMDAMRYWMPSQQPSKGRQ